MPARPRSELFRLLLPAALGLLLLAGCKTTEQNRDRVTAFFTEIAYGDNSALLDDSALKTGKLTRWEKAPTVSLKGAPTDGQRRQVDAAITRFAGATGLDVRLVESSGDIRIDFSDEREFVIRRNIRADCYAHTKRPSGRLEAVEISIGTRNVANGKSCLDHELMHAFGFFGHSHRLRSVMSAAHGEDSLTEWDILALRIAYHPAVVNGATWNETRPVAQQLIIEAVQ